MRNQVAARRGRILAQASTVAVLAGLAAACSADATRVREPLFTGSTPNQQAIIGGAPVTAAAPLPPPPGTPGAVNLAEAPAGGQQMIVVGPGESLEILAMRYGVAIQELARVNGISSPAQVTQGRTLVIPQAMPQAAYASADPLPAPAVVTPVAAVAPPPVASAPAAPVRAGDTIHIVEPGQTLFSISRNYGVAQQAVMALNGMTTETVRIGQSLKIPASGVAVPPVQTVALTTGGSQTMGEPPQTLGTLPAPAPAATPAPQAATPPAAVPDVPAATPAPAPVTVAAVDTSADPPSANGTTFRWPVQGRIISDFGTKPSGERNDGINLAVPEGTAVRAAEAGTVIYAGNELAGYGNLVLVRHTDGWVSAYAHNSALAVSKGDSVQRGQTIGQAGMTGSVTSPQVHFELRKGAKPVNPMDYLSGT